MISVEQSETVQTFIKCSSDHIQHYIVGLLSYEEVRSNLFTFSSLIVLDEQEDITDLLTAQLNTLETLRYA